MHYERQASPTRRQRRHGTGASNSSASTEAEGTGLQASASLHRPSNVRRSSVTILQSGRLITSPVATGDMKQPLGDLRVVDRATYSKVHTKLYHSLGENNARKVLRTFDANHSGAIPAERFREALQQLHIGLSEPEVQRVVSRLDNNGFVHFDEFMAAFDGGSPLGSVSGPVGRSGNNLQTRAPWETRQGQFRARNWRALQQQEDHYVPGVLDQERQGSHGQEVEDGHLMHVLADQMHRHKDQLRLLFLKMDTDRNGTIDRTEFVGAINALGLNVAPRQVNRLFDLASKDGASGIDYVKFIGAFDGIEQPLPRAKTIRTGRSIASSLELQPEEVANTLRSSALYNLRQRLYSKSTNAHLLFRIADKNNDGCLNIDELTACCKTLVPAIDKRAVAVLLDNMEPGNDGHYDYRTFISELLDDGVGHPRLVEPTLAREACPEPNRFGWGESPMWTRPITPLSLRSLSLPYTRSQSDACSPTAASMPTASSAWTGRHSHMDQHLEVPAAHELAVAPLLDSLQIAHEGSGLTVPRHRSTSVLGEQGRTHFSIADRQSDCQSVASTNRSIDPNAFRPHTSCIGSSAYAPPSAATSGRSARFWSLMHPDTFHITSVDPASSQHSSLSSTYVRKGESGFLDYQAQDKGRKLRLEEQAKQRFEHSCAVESARLTRDSFAEEGREAARMQTNHDLKERYEERMQLQNELHKKSERLPQFTRRSGMFADAPATSVA